MIEIILLLTGLFIGIFCGFFIGKSVILQKGDISTQINTIQGLTTQIAEMKTKFEVIEKSREEMDKIKDKYSEEKERRFKEFIENNQKLFGEIKEGSLKSDKEKEERIKELLIVNKKFLEEQKVSTERFLKEQGLSREEIDKKRDAQIHDMKTIIDRFTKTILGTKQRGIVGESILSDVLNNSIKAGVVKKDLKIGSKSVEFAWDLGDGKYIPIDSKLPDVFELYEIYLTSPDLEKVLLKKKIRDRIKKNILEIQKYQNQGNTIDNCILVVPNGVLDVCPEIVGDGRESRVFICSYTDVFPIAHLLHEQYLRMKEEGDVGKYKKMVEQLFGILEKVLTKTEVIDRAIITINNANMSVKEEVGKGRRI